MIQRSVALSSDPRHRRLSAAIRRTLAYADLFDYPLKAHEVHRYLHGEQASSSELREVLAIGVDGVVSHEDFYALPGRLSTVAERRRKQALSAPLLARARFYALLIKHLPFVRMIGVTGSLSMRNVAQRPDIDLMVVVAPGRVWLCRAAVIAVVHLAHLLGDTLCPNYVVSEDALALDDTTIYGAHELAQMEPLFGRAVYRRLWVCNPQVHTYLPNARPHRLPKDRLFPGCGLGKRLAEHLLSGSLGTRLEEWERRRKVARLRRGQEDLPAEIILSEDQCKGHFSRHRARVLAAYRARLAQL